MPTSLVMSPSIVGAATAGTLTLSSHSLVDIGRIALPGAVQDVRSPDLFPDTSRRWRPWRVPSRCITGKGKHAPTVYQRPHGRPRAGLSGSNIEKRGYATIRQSLAQPNLEAKPVPHDDPP